MVLEIAICDTNATYRKYERSIIEFYFKERFVEYVIREYASGEEILKSNYTKVDLFILEIEFNEGKNGIQLAKSIREYNHEAEIIFITSNIEEAHNAFEVGAIRYLIKPVENSKFYEGLESAFQAIDKNSVKYVRLKQGKKFIQVDYGNIIYFETMNRKLKVVTTYRTYIVDNRINDLSRLLVDKGFFRIHKSYLINLRYVLEYSQVSVTMQNLDIVYISRLKVKEFRNTFDTYTEDHCIEYKMTT